MQDKIQKLFGFFKNIKNQPFYTSCIGQIVQIYELNPESLKFILFNLNQLVFTNCKQIRLRLKHRLIAASLVGKLNRIYSGRVKQFIDDAANMDLQNFQLQNSNKAEQFFQGNKWQQLDLLKIIENQRLLYSTRKGMENEGKVIASEQDQNKIFDSFLDMNHATMLNISNSFQDVEIGDYEVFGEAIRVQQQKYNSKVQKMNQKAKQKISSVQLTVSNPFNLLYEICINNFLNQEWQLRHLSVLIMKQLVLNSQFLGFSYTFTLSEAQALQNRFQTVSLITKDALVKHISDPSKKKKMLDEVIGKCMIVLSLDRFADYQGQQSIILIRCVASQILSMCFKGIQPQRQVSMIKMIKKLFQKQSPFISNSAKFTWQVKHSFLYFIMTLLKEDKKLGKLFCSSLEESFIKMLSNDQVDQIILCICQIYETFVGQPYFSQQKVDRTNRQIWSIVEGMDDLAVSARYTLSLLLLLFPHFKLNEGNCIDRLKKFYLSKVSQVRSQLYLLINNLYAKKKPIEDGKIVQRSLVQILQAGIVESKQDNFKRICDIMPHLMPYVIKNKNVRKIIQFINTCVTPSAYTQQIITTKFLMNNDKSACTLNQYLYIYLIQNVHNLVGVYIDKRIWKIAMVIRECFRNSVDGLEELLIGVDKNNQKNLRGKMFIYLMLNDLLSQHKNLKIYEQYRESSIALITKTQFSQVHDNQITKIYLPQLQKIMQAIVDNQEYPKQVKNVEALASIAQILDSIKKGQAAKNSLELAKKLSLFYSMPLNQYLLGDIEIALRILDNITGIQRQVLRDIRILATNFLISLSQPGQISNLNSVIKSIMQSIKIDNYSFLSQACAKAAVGLSLSLIKNNKMAIYNKFNNNLCYHVSTNYQTTTLSPLDQAQNSIKLQGQYMQGMRKYIVQMGSQYGDYMKNSWRYFLCQNNEKKLNVAEQTNRILTLLSGTTTAILSIDNKPIDGDQCFIHKLTKVLTQFMNNNFANSPFKASIDIKLKKIISDCMIYLSNNYGQNSNVFFSWFIKQLQFQRLTMFQVLESVGESDIVALAPVCSLFIMQIIRSMSKPSLHDSAMNSLSNLIVGVYTNNSNPNFSPYLTKVAAEGVQFIRNFKNTANFQYKIDIELHKDIQLRNYQQQGITWLGFLTKYNLCGALCDDMGLGKTLQTLIVIQNQTKRAVDNKQQVINSIVICPTTLVQHWAYQYQKYFPVPLCSVITIQNKQIFNNFKAKFTIKNKPQIIIVSYSVIEKSQGFFQDYNFNFIVLDEGHLIKNTKTNKFKAIKKMNGLHRFILTGTPIQNRLIQLWGLFDFLMPGYLYSEELFKKHYQKLFQVNLTTFKEDQLLFSDDQRRTLQKLHFKVMPFIMRRMKNDVLKQLPQKIINDYYCTLSATQIKHYKDLQQKIKEQSQTKSLNPLANLHEMIKIANHPYLLGSYSNINWEDSGKFVALGQLFQNLGFSGQSQNSQNKAIIFAKQKATIDIIEKYIKQVHQGLCYLKLTADIRQIQRFSVAQTFNGDSGIRILLVTKAIGGVGLNLTSANTVIMFDSDYNPTVDMQAIDRAHRIGQKRVLTVYRMITKDTLQERIMGIQKFKTNLANAVVNLDNASIKNLTESKLPDLLQNVRDLQKDLEQAKQKINTGLYGSIIAQMQKDAIEPEQFSKKY